MGTRKKFAVVEFLEEKAVEVVPFNWVDEINKKCVYPQGPKAAALRRDANSVPFHKWPIYAIRLLYITDKFSKADKKADNLQYTSKLDTSGESSEEEPVGRKRKPRTAYSPSPERRQRNQPRKLTSRKVVKLESSKLSSLYCQGEDSTRQLQAELSDHPQPVPTVSHSQSDSNLNLLTCNILDLPPSDDRQLEVNVTEQCHAPNSSSLDLGRSFFPSSPVASISSTELYLNAAPSTTGQASRFVEPENSLTEAPKCHGDCYRREFELFQRRMFSELHDIKDDLGAIKANTFRSSGQPTECPFSIPVATENNLEAAEEKLCDRTQRKIFEKWAAQVGGCDYKNHCRRILKAVFTQDLSRKINFTGRNSKLAFANLKLQDAIVSSVVHSNDVHRSQVEKVIKDWFRNSGDHNGGRDRRRLHRH